MELTQFRSLYAMAYDRSVTQAATRLGLAQPALSLQIKALEVKLDEVLFTCERKQMQRTQAGEILYQHVQTVIATIEEAKTEVAAFQHLMRGNLAIATSDTKWAYILPPVLRQFRAHYPQVRIDIRSRMSSQVLQLAVEHEVDFGIATLPMAHRRRRGGPARARGGYHEPRSSSTGPRPGGVPGQTPLTRRRGVIAHAADSPPARKVLGADLLIL